MHSDNKFSLRIGTFEPRKVVSTVFNIMFDVLQRDKKASFFFIGAEDEKDIAGKATRRFQFYSDFTLLIFYRFLFHIRLQSSFL